MIYNNGESDAHRQGESGTLLTSMDDRDSNLMGNGKQVESEQDTGYKQESERFDSHFQIEIESHDSYVENFISEESGLRVDRMEQKFSGGEDEALAVWVKWRGKWQAGIKCARADWPLSTLKAKPTHDRKEYLVVFFPRKKHYSWADVLLVRPIDEFLEPIAHRSHKAGLKIVKDLTVARRFIMQKLTMAMLDIIDQLHMKAFIESARSVIVWREFGMEAARCKDYSDLGRMLVKLQNMIVQSCISSEWITASFKSWVQQCEDACTAESVEMLKEKQKQTRFQMRPLCWTQVSRLYQELMNSIRWGEVNSLSDVAEQSELALEWKTFKQEVMRSFSALNPAANVSDAECKRNERPKLMDVDLQACRKRAKLEVRRAEAHPPQAAEHVNTIEIDAGFFYDRETAIQPENSEAKAIETPIMNSTTSSTISSGSKNRRCMAFIEAKGRPCVRWANDGDIYCCVHLTSRFSVGTPQEKPSMTESPMCDGTTIHGNRCKHRALQGSSSCKKHRPRNDNIHLARNQVEADSVTPVSTMILERRGITTPLEMHTPVSVIGREDVERSADVSCQRSRMEPCESEGTSRCLGTFSSEGNDIPCIENPKRYLLYCDDHLPSWLKRARNGKSRIVSKEVFVELLNDCSTRQEKLHLHQACELFYRLFKSILSMRNPVPEEVQLQWAITEASKNSNVGLWLTKLVSTEIETLRRLWGFDSDKEKPVEEPTHDIMCKICSIKFSDDKEIATHWMTCHKKEAQSLFEGYMCAICLDSYKSKNVLETHFKERHHSQFFESCMLFQCIPCGGNFGNPEQLWEHVLSVHPSHFKLLGSPPSKTDESLLNSRRFACKFCSMKFNLLPDLGRHHRAVHKGATTIATTSVAAPRPLKRPYKLKTNKIRRPRFKKVLGGASYRIRNRGTAGIKRRIQVSNLIGTEVMNVQSCVNENTSLVNLENSQSLDVVPILLSKVQRTSRRPTNNDLLAICRSACCKVWLQNILEERYGELLPKRLYLKAVKLCSEQNIRISWHNEGFVCPRGCIAILDQPGCVLEKEVRTSRSIVKVDCSANNDWERDESHYVIYSENLKPNPRSKTYMLCNDISFGQEPVPIICIADENLLPAMCISGGNGSLDTSFMPWESFNYGRKSLLDPSLYLEEPKSFQLGCHCKDSTCSPSVCDHVYLFDNDYEDAKDVNGKSMHGRFPYDENRRIILEKGYLVYECNQRCGCNSSCWNRVLQNGVNARLEVFRTKKKGWGVRAGEPIMKGTFICECVGKIINHLKPSEKCTRVEDWGYIHEIDDQVNDMSRLIEDQTPYMIDSTNYGNVSRFINHSCSPNLVSYQVLVESMDSQLTHIGLYASRDIAQSEELTYDYRYKLLPGEGVPCHCEASNCRGRLY